jgi:ornithine cyclodeaminase/alanine dehydrogenase
MSEIIKTVEEVFRQKGERRTEAPPKVAIHPKENAFIHAMPAYIPGMNSAGMKWVSGYPENYKKNLPYVNGLLILNEPETGIPISVMDCTWITAMRTGAATAVAAKYLARENSSTLGIIGCGVEGRTNLEALLIVCRDLNEVRAYDVNKRNLTKYCDEMTEKYGLRVVPVNSPRKAVEGCDIIVTATPILKHPNPPIEASWFNNGAFACALDFDSYWKPIAMHSMDKFCTDDVDQLVHFKTIGYFSDIPEIYADLGEIVAGKKVGRESKDERIMSMNLGLAIEDMATAMKVYKKAKEEDVGTWLPL